MPMPGPPREADFTSRLRDPAISARVGVWLGVAFGVCFLTGMASHLAQHPPSWFSWPASPVWLYRVNQGVHVASGTAAVPLLLVKLYAVYPRLFVRPAVRSVLHALERGSVGVLVAAAVFELASGLLSIAHWYPWAFFFPDAHLAVAWLAIGALLVHIAVQLPAVRRAYAEPVESSTEIEPAVSGVSRRSLLRATWVASAAGAVAVAGASVPWLRDAAIFSVVTGTGPQGIPINKTAAEAGVTKVARDPAYRLTVVGPRGTMALSLSDLRAMAQHTVRLPIACVEGWSAEGEWTGVRVRDLVALVGGSIDADVQFMSLQVGSRYSESVLPAAHAADPLSLLALDLAGAPLTLDHGYPCRLIAPSRPGVTQTKWVARVEASA